MNVPTERRSRPVRHGRTLLALSAAFLMLAALAVAPAWTPAASAQAGIGYTIQVEYGTAGGYGYGGYGGYGYPYGSGYGSYPFGGYGSYYGGYGNSYGGYGSLYPYGNGYTSPYTVGYGVTTTNTTPSSGVAVGISWLYCSGSNGAVWVPAGASTAGLLC